MRRWSRPWGWLVLLGAAGCGAGPAAQEVPTAPAIVVATLPAKAEEVEPERAPDDAALKQLLVDLREADKDRRSARIAEIESRFGGRGLVRALETVAPNPASPETAWFQTRQIFDRIHAIADPRSADALVAWIEAGRPSVHWRGEAGACMGEVGDVRAAKYLAERMRADPAEVYAAERFWEADEGGHLSRTDRPRVVAARLLADLAVLHPDRREELRAAAEEAVLAWIQDRPQPHANGLRFLAAAGSQRVLAPLRDWAFPAAPLPDPAAQPPFPAELETAQTALRYIGWIKDEPSFSRLTDQLKRKKDPKLDITLDGLVNGSAMLGMALRAVGHGAASGLAEWGDPRAQQPLIDFIEDETWNEDARLMACRALAYCADDTGRARVVQKVKAFSAKPGPKKEIIAACYASALAARPAPALAADLVDLISPAMKPAVRRDAARALAKLAIDRNAQASLQAKLTQQQVRGDAAIALLLGGSGDVAGVLAAVAAFDAAERSALHDQLRAVLGDAADDDPGEARLVRWAARAQAAAGVSIGGAPQRWILDRLVEGLGDVQFDNGPHTRTRVVLRVRLLRAVTAAQSAEERRGILLVLALMKERGVLATLGDDPGEAGELARKASSVPIESP